MITAWRWYRLKQDIVTSANLYIPGQRYSTGVGTKRPAPARVAARALGGCRTFRTLTRDACESGTHGLRTKGADPPLRFGFPSPLLTFAATKSIANVVPETVLAIYVLSLQGAVWLLFKGVMIFQLQPKGPFFRVTRSMPPLFKRRGTYNWERMPCLGLFYGNHLPNEGGRSDAAHTAVPGNSMQRRDLLRILGSSPCINVPMIEGSWFEKVCSVTVGRLLLDADYNVLPWNVIGQHDPATWQYRCSKIPFKKSIQIRSGVILVLGSLCPPISEIGFRANRRSPSGSAIASYKITKPTVLSSLFTHRPQSRFTPTAILQLLSIYRFINICFSLVHPILQCLSPKAQKQNKTKPTISSLAFSSLAMKLYTILLLFAAALATTDPGDTEASEGTSISFVSFRINLVSDISQTSLLQSKKVALLISSSTSKAGEWAPVSWEGLFFNVQACMKRNSSVVYWYSMDGGMIDSGCSMLSRST